MNEVLEFIIGLIITIIMGGITAFIIILNNIDEFIDWYNNKSAKR